MCFRKDQLNDRGIEPIGSIKKSPFGGNPLGPTTLVKLSLVLSYLLQADFCMECSAAIICLPLCVYFRAVEFLPQTRDLSLTAIRTIRVLRPLRAINRIPSKSFWHKYRNECFLIIS